MTRLLFCIASRGRIHRLPPKYIITTVRVFSLYLHCHSQSHLTHQSTATANRVHSSISPTTSNTHRTKYRSTYHGRQPAARCERILSNRFPFPVTSHRWRLTKAPAPLYETRKGKSQTRFMRPRRGTLRHHDKKSYTVRVIWSSISSRRGGNSSRAVTSIHVLPIAISVTC
jgi:hypothetical protein